MASSKSRYSGQDPSEHQRCNGSFSSIHYKMLMSIILKSIVKEIYRARLEHSDKPAENGWLLRYV